MIVCFLCWHDTESPVFNRNNKYQDLFAVGLGSCKFKGRELLVSTSSVTVLDNLNLSKLCFLSFLNKCCKLIIYLFLQTTHLCPSLGQTTSVDRDVACFSSTRWKTLPSQSTSTPPVLVSCASTFMHSIPTWWQWASTMAVWLSTAWRRRDRSLFTRVQPRLASTQILSGRCEWMAWQWWIGWQKFRMCALFSLISVTFCLLCVHLCILPFWELKIALRTAYFHSCHSCYCNPIQCTFFSRSAGRVMIWTTTTISILCRLMAELCPGHSSRLAEEIYILLPYYICSLHSN